MPAGEHRALLRTTLPGRSPGSCSGQGFAADASGAWFLDLGDEDTSLEDVPR